ncbi:MAG: ornithine carbamoyltransferase [Verrucomicrobia bacterium]|nr:MAG: ornithine carbamoyltransferase [Verrucomicrobiota bacterium]
MKHFLSIADVDRQEIPEIFRMAAEYKRDRQRSPSRPLKGKTWGLIFSKPSTRTRVSFEVGIRELGGEAIYLNANDIQLGRGELIKDTARVLGRLVDGAVIRAEFSGVPTINALTDDEHPCQILSDVFTIGEKRGTIAGKIVTFVGDGACNTARSWVLAAGKFDFQLRIAAPGRYRPEPEWLQQAASSVICTSDLHEAARDADVLYTDIWVSMGTELESARREAELGPYWINETIVDLAKPDALVMHCLPAHRGQEIDAQTLEANASTIFDQAENRLHVQKAILAKLAAEARST